MDIVKILTNPELQEIEQKICFLRNHMFDHMNETECFIIEIQHLMARRKKIAHRGLWDYQAELLPYIIEFNDALKGAFREMWDTIDVMRNKINYEYQGIEASLWFDTNFPTNHPLAKNAAADKRTQLQELWEAITDPDAHQAYKYGIHRSIHSNCFLEETFEEFVGLSESTPNWNEGLNPVVTKDLHLIMPFHTLFEHTDFTLYDLIYVRDFQMEINVEMEYPCHFEKYEKEV